MSLAVVLTAPARSEQRSVTLEFSGRGVWIAGIAVVFVSLLGFAISGTAGGYAAAFAGACVVGFLALQWAGMTGMRKGGRIGGITMVVAMIARFGGLGFVLWFGVSRQYFAELTERLWFFTAGGVAVVVWLISLLLGMPSARSLRADGGYTPRADWEELV